MRLIILILLIQLAYSCKKNDEKRLAETPIRYTMPEESEEHEGTWLQWPHHYQYGMSYRDDVESTWIDMTRALVNSENVHIIVYNDEEKERVEELLNQKGILLDRIDFSVYPTDDVWVRDNGPIFVHDENGNLFVQDWGFNAWGEKQDEETSTPIGFAHCDLIPSKIATDKEFSLIDLGAILINEGGSVEIDGNGTLMACESSILNKNRNAGMCKLDVEMIFKEYLGVSNFVWLKGRKGDDITDQHIDGFARFLDQSTIVTMNEEDLLEFNVRSKDISKLYEATNINNEPYDFTYVPLTTENVKKTNGESLGYKGSYINYYIANSVVLVPNYNDSNDEVANQIIQSLYPNREIIGIDVRNLYENGGMIHCVTQQQPL